ncbi:MAG: arsenite efflux transporter metallochaperone ArsD [Bacilli bacterium]
MRKLEIFEPAMCCSTGVCGPSVDSELLRITTAFKNLTSNGISVARYNLSSAPQQFIENSAVNQLLNTEGVNILPLTIVNGEVVKIRQYPTNEELATLLNVPIDFVLTELKMNSGGCGCKGGNC